MAKTDPHEGLNGAIIQTIAALLEEHDLTPTEAARKAGVATSNFHRALNYERAINLADITQIAGVFGLRTSELLGRAETRLWNRDRHAQDGT